MDSLLTGVMTSSLLSILIRFLLDTIITSAVMTLVYNGSMDSIPLLFLYHWLTNVHYPWELAAGITALQDVANLIVAIVLIFIFGRSYLGAKGLVVDPRDPKRGLDE